MLIICCQSAGRPGPTGLAGVGWVEFDRVASMVGKFLGDAKHDKNDAILSVLAVQDDGIIVRPNAM